MGKGYIKVEVRAANEALPVLAGVRVERSDGTYTDLVTNASGVTEAVEIDAPDASLSLEPEYEGEVYSTCTVYVEAERYRSVRITGVQVFDGITSILPVVAEPLYITAGTGTQYNTPVSIEIPANRVDAGSGQETPSEGVAPAILDIVAIPESVRVHLGRPTESAENVTVSFTHYIKNVCCSEIYPTWPESALRANIYCQISLVLNRFFTEWYPSRGYAFDITNSTSFDQYFVYGRNIYDNVSEIVDSIFSTYIRKSNFIEPFYAEYCNGTTATCPGLKQWGTVTLANEGYSPIQILRYYYGDEVSLYVAPLAEGAQSSYPGAALSVGSSGTAVAVVQTQLTRIRVNYPLIPSVGTIDGIFGSATRAAVIQFQQTFNLTADGIVGYATWYKLSYIFASVKKLAELGSEGITSPTVVSPQPNVTLRYGDYGESVTLLQYLLNSAAAFYPELMNITVDGVYGTMTQEAVTAFQTKRGLTADGIAGPRTWTQLYETYYAYMNSATPLNPQYPGTALRSGSTGSNVSLMQRYLNVIGSYFTSIPQLSIDGIFGTATRNAVVVFQGLFGLTTDGVIGTQTWNRIVAVYQSVTQF
ncbi:MAG: peptidoglycan-binding protein [Oscillospiraceae bacterium]|nr:peptidoglycan-binding protein [Oscillospiraceae bacterium]